MRKGGVGMSEKEKEFLSFVLLLVKVCEFIQKAQVGSLDLNDVVLILEIYELCVAIRNNFKDR